MTRTTPIGVSHHHFISFHFVSDLARLPHHHPNYMSNGIIARLPTAWALTPDFSKRNARPYLVTSPEHPDSNRIRIRHPSTCTHRVPYSNCSSNPRLFASCLMNRLTETGFSQSICGKINTNAWQFHFLQYRRLSKSDMPSHLISPHLIARSSSAKLFLQKMTE